MRIAVAGKRGMGGFILRGMHVADRLGWDVIELTKDRPLIHGRYDAIVLVKYDLGHASLLREHCELLVWDPLDAFTQWGPTMDAVEFWRESKSRIPFDVMIATSPACERAMNVMLSKKVWLLPHSADPRVQPIQRDEGGAVVYWGGRQYVESGLGTIADACRIAKRKFVVDESKGPWRSAEPVSLALHLRLPPFDSDVMRRCKPQVKLANAAAAGLPVLATDDPCVRSLGVGRTITVGNSADPHVLANAIERAVLDSPPPPAPSIDEHCERLSELLHA